MNFKNFPFETGRCSLKYEDFNTANDTSCYDNYGPECNSSYPRRTTTGVEAGLQVFLRVAKDKVNPCMDAGKGHKVHSNNIFNVINFYVFNYEFFIVYFPTVFPKLFVGYDTPTARITKHQIQLLLRPNDGKRHCRIDSSSHNHRRYFAILQSGTTEMLLR